MAWETLSFDAHGERVNLSVPRLTPEQLAAVADRVALSSQHVMTTLPVMDVVDAIDRAVARLLDVNNADRQLLEHLLPVITGFDRV